MFMSVFYSETLYSHVVMFTLDWGMKTLRNLKHKDLCTCSVFVYKCALKKNNTHYCIVRARVETKMCIYNVLYKIG